MACASGDQKGDKKDKTTSFPWEQQLCRRFSLAEIRSATQDFDDDLIIGQGGFGKVYKGPIENGVGGITVAAIKRLDCGSNQGASEFWAEIEMLSKLRHSHLVSLIGYCNDNDEMILVYEYMPRGTLYDHLYKLGTSLAWVQRLQICVGVARGLDYLHTGTGTQHGVIHRDIKSSNILLDENLAAKISDFGLSKIVPANQAFTYVNTAIKGTFGYVDPDYFTTGKLSRRTDVYAFGVILFEVLSGRRAVDSSLDEEQPSLARWAQDCIRKGRLDQLVDPTLSGQIFPKCLKKFAQIASSCLDNCPKQRPTMAEAVVSLEFVLALQGKNGDSIQLQPASITTLSKKLLGFLLPSTELNTGHIAENTSMNSKINMDVGEVLTGKQLVMNQELKQFSLGELKSVTKDLIKDNLLGQVDFGEVFKAYSPSSPGVGLAIAVQKLHTQNLRMSQELQVNGSEFACVSILAFENDLSLPEALPCLHDKVLAAAADVPVNFSENQKKQSTTPRIFGGIIKGLKGGKANQGASLEENREFVMEKLERMFSRSPFSISSIDIPDELDLAVNIDDIIIDEPMPIPSPSNITKNESDIKGKEKEREQLFEGGSADTAPRVRTAEEIRAKYRKAGDVSAVAGQAKDKLKLAGVVQSCTENYASMANELAKRMENRKWWQL